MSRILFVTLAVLSLLLAFVLKLNILYGLAILFLGLTVVSYLLDKRREFFPSGHSGREMRSDAREVDDLQSLGILEIKPKTSATPSTGSSTQPSDEIEHRPTTSKKGKTAAYKSVSKSAATKPAGDTVEMFADDMDEDHIPFEPGEEVSVARPITPKKTKSTTDNASELDRGSRVSSSRPNPSKAKPRADENYIAVQEAQDESLGQVLLPCLISLRAAINAHTVCVLSYKLDTTKYSIVGVVSKNGYARTSGSFISPMPLISSTKNRNTVEVMRVGPEGLLEDAVGYYRENIAVRNVATARIYASSDAERYLLLADSFDESFVGDATSCRLFDRYAQVIGPMLDMHFGSGDVESDGSRPRREIIADEISNARAASKELALALIYLNDAEAVSQKSKEDIAKIEEQLDKLLRRSTDKGRVEHFGELTFGVLYRGNVNDVERWAIRIQNEASKSGNGLSGGVSVGVAMLTDRHHGADELRTDASTALEEALETGACTILE